MSSSNAPLRVLLAFTAAFVAAEALDIDLAFIAALTAIALAGQPRAPGWRLLLALPAIGWLLVAAAGILVEALGQYPFAMAPALLLIFLGGFVLSGEARFSAAGLLVLVVFGVLPTQLVLAPELGASLARWVAANVAVAAAAVVAVNWVLPVDRPAEQARAGKDAGPAVSPPVAAVVLLVAVLTVVAVEPPAAPAALVGVVIVLRADVSTTGGVVRNRLAAAVLGGLAAWFVWLVALPNHNLAVLAAALAFAGWLLVMRMNEGEEACDLATKSLNVLALLIGKGFSVVFDNADDLFPERLAGVVLGVGFAVVGLIVADAVGRRAPGSLWRRAVSR